MRISADGFVAGPQGEIDWLLKTMDEEAIAWLEDTLWQAGVHIMGSRTFQDMKNYWPTATNPLARPMNEIPKVVFSKQEPNELSAVTQTTQALKDAIRSDAEHGIKPLATQDLAGWMNVPVARGDLATEIQTLKSQEGKFILAHGGARFAQSLVAAGVVDEYRLLVHPVILGKGLPLFSTATAPVFLRLENSHTLKSGVIANTYVPVN